MIESITLGSLFDGSGGFPLAGAIHGIDPLWASEVEPYPIAVTRSRFPQMQHLGDVSRINGRDIIPVNILTFGSPCQDLSVAGKREGLKHDDLGDDEVTRSGLLMEAARIIREMREETHGASPTFAVWENVPGAFNSNRGEDFRTVIETFARIADPDVNIPRPNSGKWTYAGEMLGKGYSIAWRTLDAQYWGVPQRRRRIYLVADFAGQRAGQILFERCGVSRDYCQSDETGETSSDTSGECPESPDSAGFNGHKSVTGNICYNPERSPCIETKMPPNVITAAFISGQGAKAGGVGYDEKICPTTKAEAGGNSIPSVICPASGYGETGRGYWQPGIQTLRAEGENRPSRPSNLVCYPENGIARTLTARHDGSPCLDRGQNIIAEVFDARENGDGKASNTLTGDHQNRVTGYSALCVQKEAEDHHATTYKLSGYAGYHEGIGTLRANGGDAGAGSETLISEKAKNRYIVRRLTPTECARLQGFPDEWGRLSPKDRMDDAEVAFWNEVRQTKARIDGKKLPPLTATQTLRWYNRLYSESAEYKMWGNGIALPTAAAVIGAIAEEIRHKSEVTAL